MQQKRAERGREGTVATSLSRNSSWARFAVPAQRDGSLKRQYTARRYGFNCLYIKSLLSKKDSSGYEAETSMAGRVKWQDISGGLGSTLQGQTEPLGFNGG